MSSSTLLMMSALIILCLGMSLFVAVYRLAKLRYQSAARDAVLQAQITLHEKVITEMVDLKGQVSQNILHDALTGLPSRQVFEDRLMQTLLQSKRHALVFAILFLDLDGFKLINNALGHDIGDALLKAVSIRLQTCIRQVDTLSRFGSDEFVFLLSHLAKVETVAVVAQRILNAIAQPFNVNGHELFITASMGIATFPLDGDDAHALLKNADNALEQAKARGCHTYQFFREDMHVKSQRALLLNTCLRSDRIYQELSLLYQPELDLEMNKIVRVEALLRWHHPDFGTLLPDEFIRLAESSGKIIAIGEWVLREASRQYQAWVAEGVTLDSIAINVSLCQLENPQFVFKLFRILQEAHMPPSALMLEISEGVIGQKRERVEKTLLMLKRLGVRIAIDNFGTGHLSLQQLRCFPVDCLKIDKSLIQDIVENPESRAITHMITVLADTLQLSIVAEGVETAAQKQILQQMGCYRMQGHLLSEPLSALALLTLLQTTTTAPPI